MAGIDQLDQPSAVDVGIDLGGRDVGVAEQRLEDTEVRAPRKQVRCKGMAKHVGTDAVRRNSGVGGHLPHQLEQAHSA